MIKDENVCLHCGLCAERCPTYAWDMRKFMLQIPYAGATVIPLTAVSADSFQLSANSCMKRARRIDQNGLCQLIADS